VRWAVAAVVVVALGMRLGLLERQGLWPDEIFSLAIATGHSLEHPAAQADAAFADFVEPGSAVPAAEFRRYLAHEQPPAGLSRVIRAIRLSDTSPPLYYVLLHAWTRLAGTGDGALRAFSSFWAMACLPLLWLVSARIGGQQSAVAACVLFAFAPTSIYYSTEGRMYSLLWFCVLLTAWLTLKLRDRRAGPAQLGAWIAASVAGLLTHYFFAFVWLGMLAWWLLYPGKRGRRWALLAALLAGLAALPWYLTVPETLGRWRVTSGWLTKEPFGHDAGTAPLRLALGYVSSRVVWAGGPPADHAALVISAIAVGVLVLRCRKRAWRGRAALLWLWLGAACAGPPLLDAWRGTYTAAVPRYALGGMPAAFLLIALGLGRIGARARWAFLALVLACWLPGWKELFANTARNALPLREIAAELDVRAGERDVVLLHSIPSGVLGVARYMRGRAAIGAWIGQLGGRRMPESCDALLAGRAKAFLVIVHTVGEPAPEEVYLRASARVVRDDRRQSARIIEFAPRTGERFATSAQSARR
jgi:hypothetical protein